MKVNKRQINFYLTHKKILLVREMVYINLTRIYVELPINLYKDDIMVVIESVGFECN